MARSLIPDPLELLRQAVTRLEGRANSLAGRGLEIDQVVTTLHQLSSASITLRQVAEMAQDSFFKRLNLPTGREFAQMAATLQRVEDKLDTLLAERAGPTASMPRPSRTRQPPAAAPVPVPEAAPPAAKAAKAAKASKASKASSARRTAAPSRRRAAP